MRECTNLPLLLVQSGCFSTTLLLALILLMSRFLQHTVSRSYETARWLLFSSLSLYAVHYLLQMVFGFRAQGEDVGALINILFYTPISCLLVCTTLRISAGLKFMKRIAMIGLADTLIIIALFCTGLHIYGNLHMSWVLSAMEVVYVIQLAIFILFPAGELHRMYLRIEAETADDNTKYYLHMRSGTILLYTMGLIGALSIFNTSTVIAVATFFFLALIFYVVSFISLGFNIQSLSSIVETDNGMEEPATQPSATANLTEAQAEQIRTAIEAWRGEHGYSTPSLTSISMAQQLGIPKKQLTQYLAECEGSTFRVWLSNIRIEEAKRMLLTNAEYSIEAIAESCGFSSRSWMQEKFKASTGMTPAEWRDTRHEPNTNI